MKRHELQTEKVLPVSMRENKPRIHAVLIHNTRPDGLPDGVHCGAWLDVPTQEVWKSLYGRPYVNAEHIVRTDEDVFLEKFKDLPFIPKNWRVEHSNHLWWLVRPKVEILAPEDYLTLDTEIILEIEQVIRKVNAAKWAVNDYITLGFDFKLGTYMIMDFSTAHEDPQADDWYLLERFFRLCKHENIINLRSHARTQLHNLCYGNDQNLQSFLDFKGYDKYSYKHVYASCSRPMSPMWASLPASTCYKHEDCPGWKDGEFTPFTWIITQEPLPDEKIKSYELTWGWSKL